MKNRKRLLTLALLCMAVAFSVLGLTACGNKGDNRDPQIVAVYNAYVANANEKGSTPLSYEEWLKSIKGEKGDKGDPGKSAYEIWLDNGFTGTEQDFLNWLKNQSNNADSLGLSFALTDEDTYSVSVGLATERSVIVIPATYNNKPVTKIANKAFMGCTNLKKVTIPDSVTSIGDSAFMNCSSLTNITIGKGVTSIDKDAFRNCSSLNAIYITDIVSWCNIKSNDNPLGHNLYLNGELVTNLVIPDSVTSISKYAFSACTSLMSITIPNSVTSLNNTFSGCSSLKSITIPNSVTSLNGTFFGCTSLTSVTIPDSVTSIGGGAFYNCTSLTSVTIGKGVTSISSSAFYNCTSLTSITIPDSVTSISEYAFESCTSLTRITIPESVTSIGSYAFYGCSSLTSVTIPNSVTSISDKAFQNCSSLTSVTIGNGVTSIGSYAFQYCDSLNAVYITDIAAWCNIKFNDYHSNPLCYAHNLYLNEELVTDLVIPDNVTSIDNWTVSNCTSLTSVTIPDSVTSIGSWAFNYCTSLNMVYITDIAAWCNIKFNDYASNPLSYAHNLCLNGKLITNLVIPDSITSISEYVFYSCTSLTSVTIPDSVTSIGNSAFRNCPIKYASAPAFAFGYIDKNKLKSAIITSGNSIGNNAFYGCSSLTSVTIPNSVTSISEYAFSGCKSLTSVTIGSGVTSIGDSAFQYCHKLVEVINKSNLNITKGRHNNGYLGYYALNVKTDGQSDIVNKNDYLFYTYNNINYLLGYVGNDTNLSLPNKYNGKDYQIHKFAFYDCTSLTSVTMGNGVTSISNNAFYNCTSLTSVTFSNNITRIDDSAFSDCYSLTSVTISDNVTWIGYNAFYNCTSLTSVTIPDSVINISDNAFSGCNNIQTAFYKGGKMQWDNLLKGNGLANVINKLYFYSEAKPTDSGKYWHYAADGVTPVIW